MTYALLIYSGHPDGASAEESRKLVVKHQGLQKRLNKTGALLESARLELPKTAKVVRRTEIGGDEFALTEGPYMETREWLVGFYLMDGTEAEVVKAAESICPFNGHIEFREVNWMRPK